MRIGRDEARASAISGTNAERIVVRGQDLAGELIGTIGFTDHIWLLVTGQLPDAGQRRLLDACLVAIAEHGLVPSVVAARMTLAAAPEAIHGAVAAGLLGCGSVILGAAQEAGSFLARIAGSPLHDPATAIGERRAAGLAIPGYGHPLHKEGDPRAHRLFAVAEEENRFGAHATAARAIEDMLPALTGRPLRINVSGAIAAVLLDAGYPLLALRGVPLLARTASLIAHLLEEQQRPIGFAMAHAASTSIAYDGAAPAGFVHDER